MPVRPAAGGGLLLWFGLRSRQSGVALAAVLWMVAALTVIVSGMAFSVRTDTGVARAQLERTRFSMYLDGALQVAAADLAARYDKQWVEDRLTYRLLGFDVRIDVVGVGGFVNLNHADVRQMSAMLEHLGGMSQDDAADLAERIRAWRSPVPMQSDGLDALYQERGLTFPARRGAFVFSQDLSQVVGLSSSVYDKIRDFVTVVDGAGILNLRWVPEPLLHALLPHDPAAVSAIIAGRQRRESALAGIGDFGGVPVSNWQESSYRLTASISHGGVVWSRTAWVDLQAGCAGVSAWCWLLHEDVAVSRDRIDQ